MGTNSTLNKSSIFLFVLLFLFGSFSSLFAKNHSYPHFSKSTHKPKSPNWTLNKNKVDVLVLGASIKEIYWNYAPERIQKVLTFDGNGRYIHYEVLSQNLKEVLFTVVPDCRDGDSLCIIKRIIVQSKQYQTPRHLRVGMNYKDINKSKQRLDFLGWFEGNLVIRTVNDQINYVLNTEGIPKNWYATMEPDSLPKNTVIMNLVISGKDMEGFTMAEFDSLQLKKIFKPLHTRKPKDLAAVKKIDSSQYLVHHGETLFSIAKKKKVTLADLLAANPQLVNGNIKKDQKIKIPNLETKNRLIEVDSDHGKETTAPVFLKTKNYVFGSSASRDSVSLDSSKPKVITGSVQDSTLKTN